MWFSVDIYSFHLLHPIGYKWIMKANSDLRGRKLIRTCSHVLKPEQTPEVSVTA